MRSASIRAQVILLVLAIVLPLGGLGIYAVYTEFTVSATRAEGSALSLAEVTAANLRQFLTDSERTLGDLAAHDDVRGMDPETCRPILQELTRFVPQYENIFLLDREGGFVCSGVPPPEPLPPPPLAADWFREAITTGGVALGRPQQGLLSGRWISVLAHPVLDDAGGVVGVVALAIDLIRFQAILQGPTLPPGAVITIDDLDGIVVARSVDAEEWVGRELPSADVPGRVLQQPRGITRARGAEGTDRVWGFAAIPGSNWRVWAGVPTAWVYAPVWEAAIRKGLVGLVVFLLVGLLSYSLYRRISTSLSELVEGTRRAALGHPAPIRLTGPAEVVQVAEQFRRTLEARERAEEEHRKTLERYERVVRATNDAVWDWDIEADRITWNENLAHLFGHSPAQLTAEPAPWSSRVHPADRERVLAGLRRVLDHGASTWSEEYRFLKSDGSWSHVHDRGYLERDAEGRPVRMTGAMMDITVRREAMEAVRRAEERYRSIVENAVFGIFVATPDGRFVEANAALVEMLAYRSPADLKARSVLSLFRRPETRDRFVALQRQHRRIEGFEAGWVRSDGAVVRVRLNGNPVPRGEEGIVYEIIAEDVTDRRLLEEQLRHAQKMEAVGRLAGGVAHDFNNLLTVVTSEAHELLSELGEEGPLGRAARHILMSSERGAALTHQLLAFSRRQVLQPRLVNLNDVVSSTEEMLRSVVGTDVELETVLDPELRPIRVDPGQMEQALMNLILNARDALEDGGRIEIRTRNVELDRDRSRAPSGGPYVLLSVRDDGVGIPPELHSRVFEPFFTTKAEGKGTGLGLASVYGIATQSGGSVDFWSEPERGSEFTIYLPAVEEEASAEVEPVSIRPDRVARGRETVLVAEDEEGVRRVVVRVLRNHGYTVLEGEDGEQALSVARSHEGPIDLLLTDVVMPRMQGPELAERLRPHHPGVRVLLMSGHTEHPAVRSPTGRLALLPKPFDPAHLLEAVRAALDGTLSGLPGV